MNRYLAHRSSYPSYHVSHSAASGVFFVLGIALMLLAVHWMVLGSYLMRLQPFYSP